MDLVFAVVGRQQRFKDLLFALHFLDLERDADVTQLRLDAAPQVHESVLRQHLQSKSIEDLLQLLPFTWLVGIFQFRVRL